MLEKYLANFYFRPAKAEFGYFLAFLQIAKILGVL